MKSVRKLRSIPARKRRSILFIPGIRPDFFKNLNFLNCDSFVFDLEDGVASTHKGKAREILLKLLTEHDFGTKEIIIRINNPRSEHYRDDIKLLYAAMPHSIMIPKVESRDEILQVNWDISAIEQNQKRPQATEILPRLESSKGFYARQEIVTSCPRITSIGFGAEDLSADLHIERVPMRENPLLSHVMIELIFLARATNIDYIDSVFPWFQTKEELDEFEQECLYARHMGAIGKMLIHPNHIEICNRVFTPSQEEIKRAENSLKTLDKALKKGLGAAIFDNRMIDAPQIKAARALLKRATLLGIYQENK